MFKKLMLLASVVASVSIFAPAAASASWLHSGEPITANKVVTLTGTTAQAGEFGAVICEETTATLEMKKGTTEGVVKSFLVHNPTTNCDVEGLLKAVCGTRSLHAVQITGTPKATINANNTISVSGIELHYLFGNTEEPCVEVILEGNITATPNNPNSISNLTLSGELIDQVFGGFTVGGLLGVSPATTYAIKGQ